VRREHSRRHVACIIKILEVSSAYINHTIQHKPDRAKLIIHKMYVVPIFIYAGLLRRAQISTINWNKLEAVQNTSHRTIAGSPWLVKNVYVHVLTNIQTIRSTITSITKTCFIEHSSAHQHMHEIGFRKTPIGNWTIPSWQWKR